MDEVKSIKKVKINDQNMLHHIILAYSRRTALTTNDVIQGSTTENSDRTSRHIFGSKGQSGAL